MGFATARATDGCKSPDWDPGNPTPSSERAASILSPKASPVSTEMSSFYNLFYNTALSVACNLLRAVPEVKNTMTV